MPRAKRAPKRRRIISLEDAHLHYFLTGGWGEFPYLGNMWGQVPSQVHAWEANRDALVAMWSDPARKGEVLKLACFCPPLTIPGPGHRPYFWWKNDAPEPRPEHETETEYLKRLDLLTPDERGALRCQG